MRVLVALLLILATSAAVSAYTATGNISGRIVSTSITVNSQSFGELVANSTLYYYKTNSGVDHVTDGVNASNIVPFASVDFATNSGYVEIELGANQTLPNTAKILVDNDPTPNSNTTVDASQIQITGNESNKAEITYAGTSGDKRIAYTSDGNIYVFVNTGSAVGGDINVDIRLTAV